MNTKTTPQKPLYAPAYKRLEDDCGNSILFMFRFNLTRENEYAYGCAAICESELVYCLNDGELKRLDILQMQEIEYVQYFGCAAIEYKADGELIELCRSDMKNALALQSATKRLKAISQGRTFEKAEEEESCCPKCGTPYKHGSKVCTMCANRKKLIMRLIPFASPFKAQLAVAILLFFCISGINVLVPLINRTLIDNYITADNPSTNGFVLVVASLAGAALVIAIMQAIRSIILVKVGNKVAVSLRELVYRKVQTLSLSGVSKRTVGEIYQRVTSDTNVLKDFLTGDLPDVIQLGLIFVAIIVVMLSMNWLLTLIILIPIPLVMMMFYLLRTFMNRLYHRQWQSESAVNTLLHDVFSGIRVVKVFGTEAFENERFRKAARKVADISKQNERTWNMIMPFANFLLGVGEYAVLFYVGSRVLTGEMTLGQLSQFLSYVGILYGPIRYAAFLPRRITRCMTSLAKVFEIVDEEPEIPDGEDILDETLKGNIAFKDVSFGYNSYEDVLKHIDVDINRGEMVGIVGRSGVGKSTMINLAMRLYDVTGGEILVDGKNIKSFSQHSLRSQIGVVLQENFLFRGTIYSNIAYAKSDCTPEEVMKAARIAGAHSFIMKQPDGYNTIVGERGLTLSGGERQRIAIARAVLRNPKILILDEATASLDTETEKQIQDSINRLTSGRTTIAIAHRLSTLRNATKLIVLEKGGVEEVGSHEQLMKNKGRYYKLVMAQRQMSKMKK